MLGLFVLVVLVSYQLLHADSASEKVTSLEPVRIVGAEETVFSWAKESCEEEDIPDLPARAFRDARDRVHLISAHHINRQFVGPTLDRVSHDCNVTMPSGNRSQPSLFDDREWLAAPYTRDGRTVYSLVHNEYRGNEHPGDVPPACTSTAGTTRSRWPSPVTAEHHPRCQTAPTAPRCQHPVPLRAGCGALRHLQPQQHRSQGRRLLLRVRRRSATRPAGAWVLPDSNKPPR